MYLKDVEGEPPWPVKAKSESNKHAMREHGAVIPMNLSEISIQKSTRLEQSGAISHYANRLSMETANVLLVLRQSLSVTRAWVNPLCRKNNCGVRHFRSDAIESKSLRRASIRLKINLAMGINHSLVYRVTLEQLSTAERGTFSMVQRLMNSSPGAVLIFFLT